MLNDKELTTPRPELFLNPVTPKDTWVVAELAEASALDCGMPRPLWSQCNQEFVRREVLRTGFLPAMVPIPALQVTQTPITKTQRRAVPERAQEEAKRMLAFSNIQFYCFTRGESWWTGPHSFVADTLYSYALMYCYHLAIPITAVLSGAQPRKPPGARGRPRGSTKTALNVHHSGPSNWEQWKELVVQEKAEAERLREDWVAKVEVAEEARRAFRSASHTTWEEYKAETK